MCLYSYRQVIRLSTYPVCPIHFVSHNFERFLVLRHMKSFDKESHDSIQPDEWIVTGRTLHIPTPWGCSSNFCVAFKNFFLKLAFRKLSLHIKLHDIDVPLHMPQTFHPIRLVLLFTNMYFIYICQPSSKAGAYDVRDMLLSKVIFRRS